MSSLTDPYDSPSIMLAQIQSGLVVSGIPTAQITVAKSIMSGDVLSSFRTSGTGGYQLITLRLARNQTEPLLGGRFTQVADIVRADMYVKYNFGPNYNASGALATLEVMVRDFKTSVLSGVWSSGSPPMPYLVSETRPQAQEKLARASLDYKLRYVY